MHKYTPAMCIKVINEESLFFLRNVTNLRNLNITNISGYSNKTTTNKRSRVTTLTTTKTIANTQFKERGAKKEYCGRKKRIRQRKAPIVGIR